MFQPKHGFQIESCHFPLQTAFVDAAPKGNGSRVFVFGNGEVVKNGDQPLRVNPGRHVVAFSVKGLSYQAKETERKFTALCRTERTGET